MNVKAADNEKMVATPLVAGGVLGLGALGSRVLDKALDQGGLKRNFTFNKDAIRAIEEYAKAKPTDVANPSKFIYRYSDLAHRAANAQLFNEDPRKVWEWSTNEANLQRIISKPAVSIYRKLSRFEGEGLAKLQRRLAKVLGARKASFIVNKIVRNAVNPLLRMSAMLTSDFSPVADVTRGISNRARNTAIRRLTHIAEIAQSPERALIRVMHEGASFPWIIRGAGYGRTELTREALSNLGATGAWTIEPGTGKLIQNPNRPFSLKPGINGVEDLRAAIDRSPKLSYVAEKLSGAYKGAPFGLLMKTFRGMQKFRNPRVGIPLAIGAASLGALGLTNLGRNIYDRNHRPWYKNLIDSIKEKLS